MGPYYGLFTGDALLSNAWVNVATKGGWTDPGYLEVGNAPTMINVSESRTQFVIWCIIKSALLVAADLSVMNSSDPFLQILKNRELISISQDALGHIGRLVATGSAGNITTMENVKPRDSADQRQEEDETKAVETEADAQHAAEIFGAFGGVGVTACVFEVAKITSPQRWTINNGTLELDGTHTGAGAYTVNSGGTLAGGGSTDGLITLNSGSVISPGSSPGTLATGSETWNGGASYLWEINDSATWPDGANKGMDPGWDWLDITGTLTIASTALNPFIIDIDSWSGGGLGEAARFDSFSKGDGIFDYEFIIATASGGIIGFDASLFSLDDSGFTNSNPQAGWYWEITADANNVYLQAFAVPEPSSTALLGLGGLVLALRRRRA